jgi:PAS domain S-box-containing protein
LRTLVSTSQRIVRRIGILISSVNRESWTMRTAIDSRKFHAGLLLAGLLTPTFLWPGFWSRTLSTTGFLPHSYCFVYQPGVIWLNGGSDVVIGLSYLAISATLALLVHKARKEIPFSWMFLAFGVFILACGLTHLMEVWTLWQPRYWLSGELKLITALASVATAILLPPLVPRVIALVQDAQLSRSRKRQLESANDDLNRLNQRLKQLDDMKTRFFANASHELRTPLTLILGPIAKLRAAPELAPAHSHSLELIGRNAQMLLSRVNELLDLSKLDAGKLKLHRVDADLAGIVRLLASNFESLAVDRHITFELDVPPSLPARIDSEKLQRVLLNLLANAFKFTPPHGIVLCALRTEQEYAVIEVADSGPGIASELREAIFERFRQSGDSELRGQGTGLGLAIVKEFVELHGGRVEVGESAFKGALFRARIPLLASDPSALDSEPQHLSETAMQGALGEVQSAHATPASPAAEGASTELVLIVEDNADMQTFLRDSLSDLYRVAVAGDGRQGLAAALAIKPDLILSDFLMPGMRGDELLREVRRHPALKAIPMIVLTARADDELGAQLLQEGAQDYVRKPFSTIELLARVRNLVSTKRVRDALQKELHTQDEDLSRLTQQLIGNRQALQHSVEAQHESEQRWRAVYENSAVGIGLTDLSGRMLAANPAFQRIVGFTEEELQGGPLLELISTDDHESSRAHVAELLDGTRREYHLEKRYKRKDGSFVWTHSSVSLIAGTQTTPPMLLRIVEDISARKAAQSELLAIRDKLAAELDAMTRLHELSTRLLATMTLQPLLEEVLDATIALQSADFGNVQLYNRQECALEIVAQRGFQPEFLDYFKRVSDEGAACGRALHHRERIIVEDVHSDPSFAPHLPIVTNAGYRAVQSTPLFSHDGEPLGMISTHFREPHRPSERELRMTDLYARLAAEMIERKQAEDERQKLASLVENSSDFIGIATLEGQAEFVNRAGRELVGLQSDAEVRTSILDYVIAEDRDKVEQHILPAVIRAGRWDGEMRFRHFKTGAAIPMLQHVFFIKQHGSGRRLALATISRDITERKRAEAALHTAQAELAHVTRVMSMGELTASIAHEINQPLTAIVTNGNASLRWLARDVPDLEEARRSLEHIVRDGMRASEVTGRIRAFSRKTAPQKTGLNVNEVIEETATLAQSQIDKHQIALQLELAMLPPVPGDRVQVQQVILNLIMNGIDAMKQITDWPRELLIRSAAHASDHVLVAVQDCGIGVDPGYADRLFDAFFTTKPGGMGLGLSISRRIVEAHGGRLWAASNDEHGITLSFTLPTGGELV